MSLCCDNIDGVTYGMGRCQAGPVWCSHVIVCLFFFCTGIHCVSFFVAIVAFRTLPWPCFTALSTILLLLTSPYSLRCVCPQRRMHHRLKLGHLRCAFTDKSAVYCWQRTFSSFAHPSSIECMFEKQFANYTDI